MRHGDFDAGDPDQAGQRCEPGVSLFRSGSSKARRGLHPLGRTVGRAGRRATHPFFSSSPSPSYAGNRDRSDRHLGWDGNVDARYWVVDPGGFAGYGTPKLSSLGASGSQTAVGHNPVACRAPTRERWPADGGSAMPLLRLLHFT
jgi:hypothetical protein